MLVLITYSYDLDVASGRNAYLSVTRFLKRLFNQHGETDIHYMERAFNEIGDLVVDWEHDRMHYTAEQHCKNFDRIDFIIVIGDLQVVLPWDPRATQIVSLLHMAKTTLKPVLAVGFGAFAAIYSLATKGTRFHILNGPFGDTIDKLPSFPRYATSSGAFPSAWLDKETGDLYTFTAKTENVWQPVCNIGMHAVSRLKKVSILDEHFPIPSHLLQGPNLITLAPSQYLGSVTADSQTCHLSTNVYNHPLLRNLPSASKSFQVKMYPHWRLNRDGALPTREYSQGVGGSDHGIKNNNNPQDHSRYHHHHAINSVHLHSASSTAAGTAVAVMSGSPVSKAAVAHVNKNNNHHSTSSKTGPSPPAKSLLLLMGEAIVSPLIFLKQERMLLIATHLNGDKKSATSTATAATVEGGGGDDLDLRVLISNFIGMILSCYHDHSLRESNGKIDISLHELLFPRFPFITAQQQAQATQQALSQQLAGHGQAEPVRKASLLPPTAATAAATSQQHHHHPDQPRYAPPVARMKIAPLSHLLPLEKIDPPILDMFVRLTPRLLPIATPGQAGQASSGHGQASSGHGHGQASSGYGQASSGYGQSAAMIGGHSSSLSSSSHSAGGIVPGSRPLTMSGNIDWYALTAHRRSSSKGRRPKIIVQNPYHQRSVRVEQTLAQLGYTYPPADTTVMQTQTQTLAEQVASGRAGGGRVGSKGGSSSRDRSRSRSRSPLATSFLATMEDSNHGDIPDINRDVLAGSIMLLQDSSITVRRQHHLDYQRYQESMRLAASRGGSGGGGDGGSGSGHGSPGGGGGVRFGEITMPSLVINNNNNNNHTANSNGYNRSTSPTTIRQPQSTNDNQTTIAQWIETYQLDLSKAKHEDQQQLLQTQTQPKKKTGANNTTPKPPTTPRRSQITPATISPRHLQVSAMNSPRQAAAAANTIVTPIHNTVQSRLLIKPRTAQEIMSVKMHQYLPVDHPVLTKVMMELQLEQQEDIQYLRQQQTQQQAAFLDNHAAVAEEDGSYYQSSYHPGESSSMLTPRMVNSILDEHISEYTSTPSHPHHDHYSHTSPRHRHHNEQQEQLIQLRSQQQSSSGSEASSQQQYHGAAYNRSNNMNMKPPVTLNSAYAMSKLPMSVRKTIAEQLVSSPFAPVTTTAPAPTVQHTSPAKAAQPMQQSQLPAAAVAEPAELANGPVIQVSTPRDSPRSNYLTMTQKIATQEEGEGEGQRPAEGSTTKKDQQPYRGHYKVPYQSQLEREIKEAYANRQKCLAGPFQTIFGKANTAMPIREEGQIRPHGPYPEHPGITLPKGTVANDWIYMKKEYNDPILFIGGVWKR